MYKLFNSSSNLTVSLYLQSDIMNQFLLEGLNVNVHFPKLIQIHLFITSFVLYCFCRTKKWRKGFGTESSMFTSDDLNKKLCSVNQSYQFQKDFTYAKWVRFMSKYINIQKEHFVLAGIMNLKAAETTPFAGTVISISRTN